MYKKGKKIVKRKQNEVRECRRRRSEKKINARHMKRGKTALG